MKTNLLWGTILAALLAIPAAAPAADEGAALAAAPAKRIFSRGVYGINETPPAAWGAGGYATGIWKRSAPIQAQAVNTQGRKMTGVFGFTVPATGASGRLASIDAVHAIYGKSLKVPKGVAYDYTVQVGARTLKSRLFRKPMQCGACHGSVPVHGGGGTQCLTCHSTVAEVAERVHSRHGSTDCLSCHAVGFGATDRHLVAVPARDCTFCHGTLATAATVEFKRPDCGACHDASHAVPAGGTYATATGHGGMLCASCHNSPHRVITPVNLGDGVNNNCVGCHADKAAGHNGPACGSCHGSASDPHLAFRP